MLTTNTVHDFNVCRSRIMIHSTTSKSRFLIVESLLVYYHGLRVMVPYCRVS
jgi:hypothetical protein